MVVSNANKRTIVTDFGIFWPEDQNHSCPIDKAPFNRAELGLLKKEEKVIAISGVKMKWANAWLVSQITLYTSHGRHFGLGYSTLKGLYNFRRLIQF